MSIPRSWADFVREMDAIAGSQVTVRGPDTRSVVTGPDGRYRLTGLRPGAYTVSADVPVVLAGRASIEPQ
ncbi:MAG: carboxypeptidase-like regulatory domain-containing protein [Vicinamibacterales bacterium]